MTAVSPLPPINEDQVTFPVRLADYSTTADVRVQISSRPFGGTLYFIEPNGSYHIFASNDFILRKNTGTYGIGYVPSRDFFGSAGSFNWSETSLGLTRAYSQPINVNPTPDPTTLTISNSSVDENASGALVGILTATDPDRRDMTYQIIGDDAEAFGLRLNASNQVELRLRPGVSLDYERTPTVLVKLQAYDGFGPQATLNVNVQVNDIVETITGDDEGNNLTGTDNGELIVGLGGNDSLMGLGGDDTLRAGTGNDTINGGDGIDTADFSDAAGNLRVDLAVGTAQSVGGGLGVDTLTFIESLAGGSGNDALFGSSDANILIGGNGADTLDGREGTDRLVGGVGDDRYYVDSAGDIVEEQTGNGTDTIYASTDYTIGAGQSIEYLRANAGATGLTLTGNNLDNTIFGGAGNDTFAGGSAGKDAFYGKGGDDTYLVTHTTDRMYETAGGGTDTVVTSINYTLGANQELEVLRAETTSASRTLTGNSFANTIEGSNGADILNGGGGADTLKGGQGNDKYIVYAAGAAIDEASGAGTDAVQATVTTTLVANVEYLTLVGSAAIDGNGNGDANILTGNGAANTLSGNGGADKLIGGLGEDTLIGGLGSDYLTGGTGADTFAFKDLSDSVVGSARDLISDFDHAQLDIIDLSALDADANTDGDQGFDFIESNAFTGVAGQLHQIQVSSKTIVEGDVNGDGAADFQILLTSAITLQAGDFEL